jgi:hypothetical protein
LLRVQPPVPSEERAQWWLLLLLPLMLALAELLLHWPVHAAHCLLGMHWVHWPQGLLPLQQQQPPPQLLHLPLLVLRQGLPRQEAQPGVLVLQAEGC